MIRPGRYTSGSVTLEVGQEPGGIVVVKVAGQVFKFNANGFPIADEPPQGWKTSSEAPAKGKPQDD